MAARNAEVYTHTFDVDGVTKTFHLKSFATVKTGMIRKHRKDPEEGMWLILEWGAVSADDLAALDEMPIADVEALFEAWQAASKVTAGESSASST